MARKPQVRAKDKSTLGLALDHAILCSHGVAPYAPYCLFGTGWLIGYDGIVASGYRIAEDVHLAPHTETMRNAVARAGNPFSLTVIASGDVVVTGDKVRVTVPCNSMDAMPNVQPDAARQDVSEAFREAIVAASKVTTARHARVIASAVNCKSNSVVGTDGGTILEAYHGMGLSGQWLLPAEFAAVVDKVKHKPTHVGWSDTTFTIWYGRDCWVRTNFYTDDYPDTDVMFARMIADAGELRPVPAEMLGALMALKPFLDGDLITLWARGLNTASDGTGASFTFDHHMVVPDPRSVPYAGLTYAGTWGDWIAFNKDGFYWYGGMVRGITAAGV